MGTDIGKGETRLLLVGTGVWKMSRLLPDAITDAENQENDHCLITEVVVPGFHWEDHQFLTREGLKALFADHGEGGEKWVKEFGSYLKK